MPQKGLNIYKRKDGRWEGRYSKGRKANGKKIYVSVYGYKYSEVKEKLILLKAQYTNEEMITRPIFNGILTDWITHWIRDVIRPGIKPATYSSYQNKIRNHILPVLGNYQLDKLSQKDIQRFINDLGKKGLSPNSIRAVFRILDSALQKAVDTHVLLLNPCKEVTLPKRERVKIRALPLQEQKALEHAALQDKNGAAVILALYTGMRIGEICALLWEDVDFANGVIHVRRTMERIATFGETDAKTQIIFSTPKSESSNRVIPLSSHLMNYLYDVKEKSISVYVVSCKNSFTEPRLVNYRFRRLLEAAGLQPMRFHSLRHTFATRCIERNVDVTTMSSLLGHSSVKLTLDTYTDSMLEQRKSAMLLMDALFINR